MKHILSYFRFINESEDSIEMIIDLIFKGGFEFDIAIEMIKTLGPLDKNRLVDAVLAEYSEFELVKKLGRFETKTLFEILGLETSLSRPVAEWDEGNYTLEIDGKTYEIKYDDYDFIDVFDSATNRSYPTFVNYKKIFDVAERLGANRYEIYGILDYSAIYREDVVND